MENGRGRGGTRVDGRTVKTYRSHPIYGFDKIKEKVMTELNCPQMDLSPLVTTERKFNALSRLFVGNLPRDITYDDLKEMFGKFGELGQVYFNKDGAYAFINFDFKANADKAKNELQGKVVKGRAIKIRYASVTTGVKIKNLTPFVSNELLYKAFSVFGEVESVKVVVDDRGKTTGEGEVVFTDKKSAVVALKKCQEECYFLTSSLRPVVVEPLDPKDEEEGNPESSMHKNDHYRNERKEGPRFAEHNSFEHEYGMRWKRLYEMYNEKKRLLESDLQAEMEHLEQRYALVRHEHETEKLRRELMQREQEAARFRQGNMYNNQDRYGGGGGYFDRYQDQDYQGNQGGNYGGNQGGYGGNQGGNYGGNQGGYGGNQGGNYGGNQGGYGGNQGGYGGNQGGNYGGNQGGYGGNQGGNYGGNQGGNYGNKEDQYEGQQGQQGQQRQGPQGQGMKREQQQQQPPPKQQQQQPQQQQQQASQDCEMKRPRY